MNMRIKLVTAVWVALSFGGAIAQTISPPIAEYRGTKAEGMFTVDNTTDYTMIVVLETKSFAVDDKGMVQYRPLDPGVRISMGATSFMLKGHDNRMVFYKATFPAAPASFSIIPTMTKAGVLKGLRVNFILPHMIYVYQKEKLHQKDIKVQLSDGVLHIQNLSDKLGRVQNVQASKEDLGGFPLFPGQTREMPLTGDKASITFEDGFKVNVP